MRDRLRQELKKPEVQIVRAPADAGELEGRVLALEKEVRDLRRELDELRAKEP